MPGRAASLLLILLVGLAAFAGCASRTSPDEADVQITNITFSSVGPNHYLSGIATNPGPDKLDYIAVEGRFYDESNAIVGTDVDALTGGLDVGESWKFSLWYYGDASSARISEVVTT